MSLSKTVKKKVIKTLPKVIKTPTHFFLRILSRHPSISGLRNKILLPKIRVVYRHGSTTGGDIKNEINSVQSIKNSADKLIMKQCFDKAGISHAPWFHLSKIGSNKTDWDAFIKKTQFGTDKNSWLIIKQRWGSRGMGNYLIKSQVDLDKFLLSKKQLLGNYIIEEYKNYTVEYRIHATENEYFYSCRKMLKTNTPKEEKFQRHDDNCSWFVETNPKFNKPSNWNEIVEDCKKAVKAIGADLLAFDVKCTSIKTSKDKICKFIIIESCSAPAMGEITLEKYKEIIPKIAKLKYSI